ncbi:MAG: YggS family pyridoxal phosphate-dependent enzyme [Propionibacteriaceae bacterium]|nr:YggS family pyridoxal phosphate-dependent enzyme [Propionibacteriaceae bacterium]
MNDAMIAAAIIERVAAVRARIAAACALAGRDPAQVRLLPVSKTHPVSVIRAVWQTSGITRFGENRVQELSAKRSELAVDTPLTWALIGHLQTNKAATAALVADEFQALDSVRVAAVLDRSLAELGRTLDVLIEVNTSGETSKWGLAAAEVAAFADTLTRYPRLAVRGLMTVAAPVEAERGFAQLAQLCETLVANGAPGEWRELSMGMSGDFETAIGYGSTCVRVGSAIFGPRDYLA